MVLYVLRVRVAVISNRGVRKDIKVRRISRDILVGDARVDRCARSYVYMDDDKCATMITIITVVVIVIMTRSVSRQI